MTAQYIQQYIATHQAFFHTYGYAAAFFLVLLEDFAMPSPGELVLIGTSLIASQGGLHITPLLLLAWLGAVIGDNIGFAIGHFGGARLLVRYGRRLGLTHERLDRVHRFFERYGGEVVLVARFVQGARQLNGIVAGSAGMPWRRFLIYNAIGAALWVGAWGYGVYLLGKRFFDYLPLIERFSFYLGVMIVVLLLGGLLWWAWRRRSRRKVVIESDD
ncbi:DedA family protein [Acidihalobacter yilgarnensis]|uniref:DedA family protein n=1 Tax=Acidihalobacter yilgarnensis TaxID=2819280 RepID=UPI0018D40E7C|nr:DedA family protein [Acidihalobacter yilgarnensis]